MRVIQALAGKDVKDLLSNVGGGGAPAAAGAAPAAAGGAAADAEAPKEEEKKEEEKGGLIRHGCYETHMLIVPLGDLQRSQTMTWASVSSIKQILLLLCCSNTFKRSMCLEFHPTNMQVGLAAEM